MRITITEVDGASRTCDLPSGCTVLTALQKAGCTLFAPCGGAGTCGRCKVLVRSAQGTGFRLACQTQAEDDMEIVLEGTDAVIEGVAATYSATTPPFATEGQEQTRNKAPRTRAAGSPAGNRTAKRERFGLAVDIGTTTIVYYLVNRDTGTVVASKGEVNPQVAFGGDVIARITAAENRETFQTLCSLPTAAIDDALRDLCAQAHIACEDVETLALVGNTVMEHFAAHLDPTGIGISPFIPASLFGAVMPLAPAEDVPARSAYFAPAIAGYVGGDITAGLHHAGMARRHDLQLFLDIGTNGEMALGNEEAILCCATAAGPAFEGAGIAHGMPALPGAIAKVSWKARTHGGAGGFHLETIKGAPAVGLCGSGLLDAMASLLDAGIVDETGRMAGASESPAPHLITQTPSGEIACCIDPERRVWITQGDVRKVQLAKAALRAGIETLLAERGVGLDEVEELALAGGFGMNLNPASAARIGMIPPSLADCVVFLGNAAGQGAIAALESPGRAALESVAKRACYLELSTNPAFNDSYLDALLFEED